MKPVANVVREPGPIPIPRPPVLVLNGASSGSGTWTGAKKAAGGAMGRRGAAWRGHGYTAKIGNLRKHSLRRSSGRRLLQPVANVVQKRTQADRQPGDAMTCGQTTLAARYSQAGGYPLTRREMSGMRQQETCSRLRVTAAATTSVALTCRWRSRPQHQILTWPVGATSGLQTGAVSSVNVTIIIRIGIISEVDNRLKVV